MIGNPRVTPANVTQPILVPGASLVPDEVEELMRIIRKSDYSIIDHLSHTPSKMSILSLFIYSEPHRNALMKLLKNTFMPHEITVNQFENVCANISVGNGLGFTDFDFPPEGSDHNKALHISMECRGTTLSRVLVDTNRL